MTPWASIAKIEADGEHSGTGFLVTSNHVLTALHVVADKKGQPFPRLRLRFDTNAEYNDGSNVFDTDAWIEGDLWNKEQDFALLRCDALPPAKPLVLSDSSSPFRDCAAPGFAIQKPSGFTAIGKIASLNDPTPGGGPSIAIQFNFGTGVLMKGHSGAPVFVNGRVVGLLRTAFQDKLEKTMGGIVHATAVWQVVEFCNRKRPDLLSYRANVSWPNPGDSPARELANRREEFEAFQRMITGRSRERILLLRGVSGSGKTVLSGELANSAKKMGANVVSADLRGASADIVFRQFLFSLGEGVLQAAGSANGDLRFFRIIDDLSTLTRPTLLALDSWQESSDDVRQWMERRFLPEMDRMPGLIVVIGGHKVPEAGASAWGDLAVDRDLDPIISTADWLEYCQRKWPNAGIIESDIQTILAVLVDGGNKPLPDRVHNQLDALQRNLARIRQPAAPPPIPILPGRF